MRDFTSAFSYPHDTLTNISEFKVEVEFIVELFWQYDTCTVINLVPNFPIGGAPRVRSILVRDHLCPCTIGALCALPSYCWRKNTGRGP